LFNSIDSSSISHSPLSPNGDIGPMTSIVDALFPEQASLHQQQKQREQRHASTNDLTAAFDRFPLWNNHNNNNKNNNNSASAFCGGMTNGSSAFANRRQAKLHSSSRSLRTANPHYQQQQYYRAPPPARALRFPSSIIRLQSAATTTVPNNTNSTNGLQRSSSSLSTNNGTTDYQPRFASRLSSTRLATAVAPPVGSHDQIAGNSTTIDPIAPTSTASTFGVMGQPSSASAVLARSTSSTNAQPQQFVTMTQTTTTTFCYVPASGSLAYNNLPGTNRSATVPHH